MTDEYRHERNVAGLLMGLTIMVLGAVLLLDRIGVIDGWRYVSVWPVLVITVGLAKLSHRRDDGRREGGWWVFFGTWLLLNQMLILRFRQTWPVLLVAIGVSMAWKEITRRRMRGSKEPGLQRVE